MNLCSQLPQTVSIDNEVYYINTDFKNSIQFEGLFKENLTDEEFRDKALNIYYPVIPQNTDEAIQSLLWFYRCGKELKEKDEEEQQTQKEDVYSFEYDAEYIYSAFLDQYRVDLQEVDNLHWWKFKALFKALKDDNEISRIMSIRATDINKLPKEQQPEYRKLKKIYAIPRPVEETKARDALEEALMNGEDISALI